MELVADARAVPELGDDPSPFGRVQVQASDLVLVLVGHELVQASRYSLAYLGAAGLRSSSKTSATKSAYSSA